MNSEICIVEMEQTIKLAWQELTAARNMLAEQTDPDQRSDAMRQLKQVIHLLHDDG